MIQKLFFKLGSICFLGFIFTLLSVQQCWAVDYYVSSSNGNDANNGLSPDTAWQTVAKVNAKSFVAGDRILFKSGDTWEVDTGVIIKNAGEAGNYLTFTTYGGNEKAKIFQKNRSMSGNGFDNQAGNPYVKISNFEIAHWRFGIWVAKDAHHQYIENNYIHTMNPRTGMGIRFGTYSTGKFGAATGTIIDGNTVEDTPTGISIYSWSKQDDIVGNETEDSDLNIINNSVDCNTSWGNAPYATYEKTGRMNGHGIDIKEAQVYLARNKVKNCGDQNGYHCVYLGNYGATGATVEDNRFQSCGSLGLKISDMDDVLIQRNIFAFNGQAGMNIENGSENIRLINNTFYSNGTISNGHKANFFVRSSGQELDLLAQFPNSRHAPQKNITFKKNIVYDGIGGRSLVYFYTYKDPRDPVEGFVSDENLFFSPSGSYNFKAPVAIYETSLANWRQVSGHDTASVYADPQFVDAVNLNLNLDSSSPYVCHGAYLATNCGTGPGISPTATVAPRETPASTSTPIPTSTLILPTTVPTAVSTIVPSLTSVPTPTAQIQPTMEPSPIPTQQSEATLQSCSNMGVLFVVRSSPLETDDLIMANRLVELGFSVKVETADGVIASAADGMDLIVISDSGNSTSITDTFTDSPTPLLTWESYLYDDLGMAISSGLHTETQSTITIASPNDVLAAGLTETIIATDNSTANLFYSPDPAASAKIVATLANQPDNAAIFYYDIGEMMINRVAPARRVGFFGGEFLTTSGLLLFDSSIQWAAACNNEIGATPAPPPPTITPTVTPNTTPETLETSGDITGQLFEDANQNGQYEVGEPVLSGVTAILIDISTNGQVTTVTTQTDQNGAYQFLNLPEADYIISFALPPGYAQLGANAIQIRNDQGTTEAPSIGFTRDNTDVKVYLPLVEGD